MNTPRNLLEFGLGLGLVSSLAISLALALPPQGKEKAPPAKPAEKSAPTGSATYVIDTVHSTVLFKIKHLNASWAFGRFDDVSGTFTVDYDKPEKSSLKVEIKTESVDTNAEDRNKHLQSPAFFDAKQFPTITFEGKSVKKKGETWSVTGDLSLHGVTKSITVDLEHVGTAPGMRGGELCGFFGTFTLKRSDYGMKFMAEQLGDEVALTVSIEGAKS